jgi:hypothetical protein
MDCVSPPKTVSRKAGFLLLGNCSCIALLRYIHVTMQNLHFHRPWWSVAGFEPPWMGSRRVFGGDTQFMSRCQCMRIKPLFTTDITRKYHAEKRREPVHGGSASASMRLTVSARYFRFMSLDIFCGTAVALTLITLCFH